MLHSQRTRFGKLSSKFFRSLLSVLGCRPQSAAMNVYFTLSSQTLPLAGAEYDNSTTQLPLPIPSTHKPSEQTPANSAQSAGFDKFQVFAAAPAASSARTCSARAISSASRPMSAASSEGRISILMRFADIIPYLVSPRQAGMRRHILHPDGCPLSIGMERGHASGWATLWEPDRRWTAFRRSPSRIRPRRPSCPSRCPVSSRS